MIRRESVPCVPIAVSGSEKTITWSTVTVIEWPFKVKLVRPDELFEISYSPYHLDNSIGHHWPVSDAQGVTLAKVAKTLCLRSPSSRSNKSLRLTKIGFVCHKNHFESKTSRFSGSVGINDRTG